MNRPNRRCRIAVLSGLVGLVLASSARGQSELAGAEERFEVEAGPGALPGREKGPHDQPVPTSESPSDVQAGPREWLGHAPWATWSRLTGDWGGARTKFEESGVTINASYTLDWSTILSGGVRSTASSRQLLDANITLDLGVIWSLTGGTIYADMYASDGRGGSEDAGDITGVSNLATGENVQQIAELWYEQWMLDRKLRLKVGKVDANTEFAYFRFATDDFLNDSNSNSSALFEVFPTYPDPATAVNLFFHPNEHWHVGAGFFDGSLAVGNPTGRLGPASFFEGDAYFWIAEAGATWGGEAGKLGRATVGAWHSTPTFDTFDGSTADGQSGLYVMAEQQLRRPGDTEELREKGLFLFGVYGHGEEGVNPVANHVGLGLAALGTLENRRDDSAGFMANWHDMSDAPGAGFANDELAFEVYYKWQLTPAVSITPDLQYTLNPSGSATVDNAWVGQVRFMLVF
jgi:porin